jgi:hypothetical protein
LTGRSISGGVLLHDKSGAKERSDRKRQGGTASRATLSIHFSGLLGPFVGWLTSGLNNRHLAIEAAGLKRRAEEIL